MKVRLSRLDDFIGHLKEVRTVRAYYVVDTRQSPIPEATGSIQAATTVIFTAKSPDDKHHYSFMALIKSARVEPGAEDEYDKEVSKGVSELIQLFQDKYASCHLTNGVVE